MTRSFLARPLFLIPLAAALVAAPAFAVTPALAQEQDEPSDDAETAFLRAYYLEIGKSDSAAALAAYDALLARGPDGPIAAKAHVGRARCLVTLGRHAEARETLDRAKRQYPAEPAIADAYERLDANARPEQSAGAIRVANALVSEGWSREVPAYGDVAVPVLAKVLRGADPKLVERAAECLSYIGTDAACTALLEAVRSDEVAYRGALASGLVSRGGMLPPAFAAHVAELSPSPLRARVIEQAARMREPEPWLVKAFVENADVRTKVLKLDREKFPWTLPALVRAALEAGPGAARDDVVAGLAEMDGETVDESSWSALGRLSGRALDDDAALRVLSKRVLRRVKAPTADLRDSLLALDDSDARALALEWTWRHAGIGLPKRGALVEALRDYAWKISAPAAVAQRLVAVFRTAPTDEEWRLLIPGAHKEVAWHVARRFAEAGKLTVTPVDLLLAAGREESALELLWVQEPVDASWMPARAATLLDAKDGVVRQSAARLLATWHANGVTDATAHARGMAAAMPRLEARRATGEFDLLFDALMSFGDAGAAAYAAELSPEHPRADQELAMLHSAGRPEAAGVALEWVRSATREDLLDGDRMDAVETAVQVLAARRGDETVDVLAERWSSWDPQYAVALARLAVVNGLTSDGAERLLAAMIERLGEHARLTGEKVLTTEAARRVARAALASPHAAVQRQGASWETWLLDPEAVPRLGELAETGEPPVRDAALGALTAIRKADAELARVRALTERTKTEERVRALLRSETPRERMAGIAGLVALRAPDALERLLDVAATDADERVAAEARRALLALGTPLPTPPGGDDE